MARGSSYGEKPTFPVTTSKPIPKRATRDLPAVRTEEQERHLLPAPVTEPMLPAPAERQLLPAPKGHAGIPTYEFKERLFAQHRQWMVLWMVCCVGIVLGAFVLISAAAYQRTPSPHVVDYPGLQSFSIQVGGSVDAFNIWENNSQPLPPKTPIPTQTGPYSILGPPTVTPAFINQVLASYGSPAAGKGQALYDLGVKYGIDPVYGLAFFMHESLFGTTGEARTTLSLGNLRCIPTRPCIDQDRGGYAQMYSWEDGFDQFYRLLRNLYVAQWGRVTVDQIIPKYAPNSDGNDEAEYIATLKHEVDTWRAGILRP